MPCVDGREHEDAAAMKFEIDQVTAMLCSVLRVVDQTIGVDAMAEDPDVHDGLLAWWESHKADDAERG